MADDSKALTTSKSKRENNMARTVAVWAMGIAVVSGTVAAGAMLFDKDSRVRFGRFVEKMLNNFADMMDDINARDSYSSVHSDIFKKKN